MNIKQLKELVKQVVKEETDYQELFKAMLDKTGKDINSMTDTDKKKFFDQLIHERCFQLEMNNMQRA